jgi:hypothetical protein
LAKLLGLDSQEYSAIDAAIAAIQCLLLGCDNPAMAQIASQAILQLNDQSGALDSSAITVGTLDQAPKAAMLTGLSTQLQQALRIIQLLQNLANTNLKDLCAIKTVANPVPAPSASPLFSGANTTMTIVNTAPPVNTVTPFSGDKFH